MTKKEKIINLLRENNEDEIFKFNKNSTLNIFLQILDEEISDFNYEKDISYLRNLIKILPKLKINNNEKFYEKMSIIHQKIKVHLVQKPGDIEKNNSNYKTLKNIINNIELIEISLLYDYVAKCEDTKNELIDYIIFDVKNITFLKEAIKKFPNIVNFFDADDKHLIVKIIEKYISEVEKYKKESGIDSILYFDEVINIFLNSEKIIFDVVDKQNILKKIKMSIFNLEKNKERKIFYLNNLVNKINSKEFINTNSKLEYKYNLKPYFNEAINSEVDMMIENFSVDKNRTIINDYIITVDGEDSKEIDDALSAKKLKNGNYLLGVHIADPLSIIDSNNIIFDEAEKRTTSIYLSDQTYYMFPEKLSCDILSLEEKKYRNARSYFFELNQYGDVVSKQFLKSVIKVDKNMTYEQFNKILVNGARNKSLENTIKNLSNISNYLQQYYAEDELYGKINRSNTNVTNTNIIGVSNSEKVVESSMVFTNYMVAKFFKENNLPFIFRNHVIDDKMLKDLNSIKENLKYTNNSNEYIKYIDIIENIYPKASYGLKCEGHYGLGIDSYCHVTSPLRRFADVIAILCLDKLYFKDYDSNDLIYIKNMINKSSLLINNKRDSIEKFSIEYEHIKKYHK